MANPTLHKVTIDSTDVTAYVQSWKITRGMEQTISTCELKLSATVESVVTFDIDNVQHTITIERGVTVATEKTVFKGEIYIFERTGSLVNCKCKSDKHIDLSIFYHSSVVAVGWWVFFDHLVCFYRVPFSI